MRLEYLSDIKWSETEWKNLKKPVYHKLRVYFFLHELLINSKLLLLVMVALIFQQPDIYSWLTKIIWQIQYLAQNVFSWIIPL